MKKSQLIIAGALILIALAIGFVIGVSVDFPKPSGNDLSGTIGKLNNYRNVKLGENDIQLRSDLLTNAILKKQYQSYFSFHYTVITKLGSTIDFALEVANQSGDFLINYKQQVESLAEYTKILELNRLDVLLALQVIQNLSEKNQSNIGPVLNNAQMAIAQVNYKEKVVFDFIEAIEVYIENAADGYNQDLKKAHDLLLVNQVGQAVATNDKPILKYLDNKELFCVGPIDPDLSAGFTDAVKNLNNVETINAIAFYDFETIKGIELDNQQIAGSNEAIVSGFENLIGNFNELEFAFVHQIGLSGTNNSYFMPSNISSFGSEIQSLCSELQQISNTLGLL